MHPRIGSNRMSSSQPLAASGERRKGTMTIIAMRIAHSSTMNAVSQTLGSGRRSKGIAILGGAGTNAGGRVRGTKATRVEEPTDSSRLSCGQRREWAIRMCYTFPHHVADDRALHER